MRQPSMTFLVILILNLINIGNGYQEFRNPNCGQLSQAQCSLTNEFCEYNENHNVCETNNSEAFWIDVYDSRPASVTVYIIIIGLFCYFLREFIVKRIIVNKFGLLNNLDEIRKNKCILYISEIILLSIVLILWSIKGSISVIWNPKGFENLPESEISAHLYLWNIGINLVMYMYIIEMSVEGDKMRWTLKLHHMVAIMITLLNNVANQNRKDIDLMRSGIIMLMYAALEPNVFLQLLLYRINPNGYLWIHYGSTFVYIITRFLIVIFFIIAFVEWMGTEFVKDELFQNFSQYPLYGFAVILFPIMNILLNYAQFFSVQALIHICNRVRTNVKDRNELLNNPKLMELHDIWLRFDENDNGFICFDEFAVFVTSFVNDLILNKNTLILLWEALGYNTESEMSWNHFKKIFKESIEEHHDFDVTKIIKAKLKQLLSVVVDAEHFFDLYHKDDDHQDVFMQILRQTTKNIIQPNTKSLESKNKIIRFMSSLWKPKKNSMVHIPDNKGKNDELSEFSKSINTSQKTLGSFLETESN